MDSPISQEEYVAFRDFLERACGIVLGDNKQYLVSSRLNRLRQEVGLKSIDELLRLARQDPRSGLRERIVDAMTTNETLWFRDGYPFEVLKRMLLPELACRPGKPVRIWSAACSSGQEPYAISMIASEYLRETPAHRGAGVQVVATDISASMLTAARAGAYDNAALARGMSNERRNRFFVPQGERWQVTEEIRRCVTFRELNLMHSYTALGHFDIIFCRNVLIYFSAQLKRDILARLTQALEPGGYLVLGASESVAGYCDDYETLRAEGGMIYRLKKP